MTAADDPRAARPPAPASWLAIGLAIVLALFLVATRRNVEAPTMRIFPEMVESPAYASQSASPVFPDGITMRPPVPGTIARGFAPFHYGPGPIERDRAGRELANPFAPSLEVMARGREVYRHFCVPCHGPGGRGDGLVAERASAFAMSIVGKATADLADGALFHVVTRGQNNMPAHAAQVPRADRWKLVHYLRDLQGLEAGRLAQAGLDLVEDPRRHGLIATSYGEELFQENCASCHGAEGRNPERGIPTLNAPAVLAVASEDFYLDIIAHGRKGTEMPAWDEILTPSQIRSVGRYIRSWYPAGVDLAEARSAEGDVKRGQAIYRGNCAACHGRRGEGGIGPSLGSPSFLAMASDAFLLDTIIQGRGHTAMPAWKTLPSTQLAEVLAYIRSFSPQQSKADQVRAFIVSAGPDEIDVGRRLFAGSCAQCHGRDGEGGIGSRLASPSFLALADDELLRRAIVEGRPGTAMPSWRHLSSRNVAALTAFIRTWARPGDRQPATRPAGPSFGRAEFGELIYNRMCVSCHGPDGRGAVGGQLANPVFLESADDAFLWSSIAHGKDGTAMRGFLRGAPGGALVPLHPSEIDHLVAYLRQLEARGRAHDAKRPGQAGPIALGREIYHGRGACNTCHGSRGEGASGPAIGNPDFLKVASDGFLTGTIVLGREGTAMRSFGRSGQVPLTPAEVENVVAYVRSFEEQPFKEGPRVPMTDIAIAQGGELYLENCASCHGTDGRGARGNEKFNGYAPSLNNPEFLHAASDGLLLATIALGRPGTPMRPFATGIASIADLSAEEMERIVAFIRSWEPDEEVDR